MKKLVAHKLSWCDLCETEAHDTYLEKVGNHKICAMCRIFSDKELEDAGVNNSRDEYIDAKIITRKLEGK